MLGMFSRVLNMFVLAKNFLLKIERQNCFMKNVWQNFLINCLLKIETESFLIELKLHN